MCLLLCNCTCCFVSLIRCPLPPLPLVIFLNRSPRDQRQWVLTPRTRSSSTPTLPRIPLPSPQTSPILIVDGCSDLCPAFIAAIRSSHPSTPITAFLPHAPTVRPSDSAQLTALGVTLHPRQDFVGCLEKSRLVATHPRVLILSTFRCCVRRKRGQSGSRLETENADWHRDEVLQWIAVCNEQKAAHVVYISTASPELFRTELHPSRPVESIHVQAEERLRAAKGIQHWTVLRPVTLMALWVSSMTPTGREDPYTVWTRFDPEQRQQLIAPADVGRIAAKVLTDGEGHYGKVLDLAGPSQLSPREEMEVRTDGMRGLNAERVVCDSRVWEAWKARRMWFGSTVWSVWCPVMAPPLRRFVTSDVARQLLGAEPLDYRTWFITQVRNLPPQPVEAKDEPHKVCVVQ